VGYLQPALGKITMTVNDAGHPVHVKHLAVRDLPGSGTPQELMEAAGISAGQIAQAAREVLRA
jgi:transketolase